jgi:hypothetical protein
MALRELNRAEWKSYLLSSMFMFTELAIHQIPLVTGKGN